MTVGNYRELKVWDMAMELVTDIYNFTGNFPRHEVFGLSSQMRRAAVSVPSNIAEGHAKNSTREYLRHVSIAMGSLAELETQLDISLRLDYIGKKEFESVDTRIETTGKMLRGLQKSLKAKC